MKPTSPSDTRQFDLFRASLRQILDPEHPLLSLTAKIDGTHFDAAFAEYDSPDMGAPANAVRLMVGLHYLKHAFNVVLAAVGSNLGKLFAALVWSLRICLTRQQPSTRHRYGHGNRTLVMGLVSGLRLLC